MQKTFASLLVTLAVSVMGIPVAYLVGQRSAEHNVQQRLIEERARARAEQQALISDLRAGLAPVPAAAPPPAKPDTVAAVSAPLTVSAPPANHPEGIVYKLADAVAPPASAPASEPAPPAEETPAPATQAIPAAPPLSAIPRETFNAVALGATYPDIVQRFGRDGMSTLTMEDERGGLTREYLWQWPDPEDRARRITLRFVDGRLTEKSWRD